MHKITFELYIESVSETYMDFVLKTGLEIQDHGFMVSSEGSLLAST